MTTPLALQVDGAAEQRHSGPLSPRSMASEEFPKWVLMRIEALCSEAFLENRAEGSLLWHARHEWQRLAASGAGSKAHEQCLPDDPNKGPVSENVEHARHLVEQCLADVLARKQGEMLQVVRSAPGYHGGAVAIQHLGHLNMQCEHVYSPTGAERCRNVHGAVFDTMKHAAPLDTSDSSSSSKFQCWRRRFLVLTPDTLEYYRERQAWDGCVERVSSMGLTHLQDGAAGALGEEGSAMLLLHFEDTCRDEPEGELRLVAATSESATWQFLAGSPVEADVWRKEVRRACQELRERRMLLHEAVIQWLTSQQPKDEAGSGFYHDECEQGSPEILHGVPTGAGEMDAEQLQHHAADVVTFAMEHRLWDKHAGHVCGIWAGQRGEHGSTVAPPDTEVVGGSAEHAAAELDGALVVLSHVCEVWVERQILLPRMTALCEECERISRTQCEILAGKTKELEHVPQSSAVFGVKPKLQSSTDWADAIAGLRALGIMHTEQALPSVMADTLVRDVIGAVHRVLRDEHGDQEIIGADDLFPILVYVTLKSGVAQLPLVVEMMCSLCSLCGMTGYYLTTMSAVVNYACNGLLTEDDTCADADEPTDRVAAVAGGCTGHDCASKENAAKSVTVPGVMPVTAHTTRARAGKSGGSSDRPDMNAVDWDGPSLNKHTPDLDVSERSLVQRGVLDVAGDACTGRFDAELHIIDQGKSEEGICLLLFPEITGEASVDTRQHVESILLRRGNSVHYTLSVNKQILGITLHVAAEHTKASQTQMLFDSATDRDAWARALRRHPSRYRCVKKATIRTGIELDSELAGTLDVGAVIEVSGCACSTHAVALFHCL